MTNHLANHMYPITKNSQMPMAHFYNKPEHTCISTTSVSSPSFLPLLHPLITLPYLRFIISSFCPSSLRFYTELNTLLSSQISPFIYSTYHLINLIIPINPLTYIHPSLSRFLPLISLPAISSTPILKKVI